MLQPLLLEPVRRRIHRPDPRMGLSLLEMLAVVAILGVLAVVILAGFSTPSDSVKENACYVIKGEIELQAQRWYRNKGAWPANDLSDIATDGDYFPEGLPDCPVSGWSYEFDSTTQEVTINKGG